MANLSFIDRGVLKLPPGFRFHPTDEELVVQYLKRKVFSFPFPAGVIPEIDLGKFDPWDLPGVGEGERYFFHHGKARYCKGNRPKRAGRSGYWKAMGKEKEIMASGELVGMKKALVFYRGKPLHGSRTDWMMHEYRLASPIHSTKHWVACRIFKKKRSTKIAEENPQHYNRRRAQSNRSGFPSSPSSSSLSCVTDLSEESSDEEEGSSRSASSPNKGEA